ncbi:hypothetical protein [Thalassospira sp. TSL5-1]|uniref:hypothetical protein n=1 Tax=Thalassospira sp. TSL5-1 TaxID=1544451 RepID=UPI00093A5CAA|nr:hypothetical protein [Thalassospira sp. TSL5-1]OKH89680.1 hypothetical protein LF95_07080 [Thalassospira sp. TSL5-1]
MWCWRRLNCDFAKILAVLLTVMVGSLPRVAQADPPLVMPIRSVDLAGVQECYNDPHPGGFCDQCKSPNTGNYSLTNYVLLREALKAGGMDVKLVGIGSPNSARSRMMVETGMATIKADWDFNMDQNEHVLKSDAFIRSGEFFKGIYGLPENPLLKNIHDIRDLRPLIAATNLHWRLDWQVLQNMRLASLFPASTMSQMYNLIGQGRADFTLLEFSARPDMVRELNGLKLAPVADVKVALPGSQHFMVSRGDMRAERIIAVLNRGLKTLRENGLLSQCLHQGGVINAKAADWKVLNAGEPGISEHHTFDLLENHR